MHTGWPLPVHGRTPQLDRCQLYVATEKLLVYSTAISYESEQQPYSRYGVQTTQFTEGCTDTYTEQCTCERLQDTFINETCRRNIRTLTLYLTICSPINYFIIVYYA